MDSPERKNDRRPETLAYGEEMPHPQFSPATGQRIGSYELLERLGVGGIGEVWKARDSRLNRIVALKFIARERHGSSPTRDLLREARAASALNHPNIVTIFEVGESEGGAYLAMEYVEGKSLRARLAHSPVPLEEALELARQTVGGLAAAHRHGIVHRDLKPENIMLRVDGLVKLLDFGLAKLLPWAEQAAATDSLTETGQIMGTFQYMSPEQARGQPLSPASDVFSFGIILYELLAAEHPFHAATVVDTLQAILGREPPALGSRNPAVGAAMSQLVSRSLQKEAAQRQPSAVELAEELKQARSASAAPLPQPSVAHAKPLWMKVVGGTLISLLLAVGGWMGVRPSSVVSTAAVESVAIMTFQAEPGDQTGQLLSQGLPEELDGALARAGWRVASRRGVLAAGGQSDPRSLGAELGVGAVLDGSIRSYGGKFKVHVVLVSTRTGFQLWSGTFTTDAADLLAGEQKTASDIAAEMRQALAAGPKPE